MDNHLRLDGLNQMARQAGLVPAIHIFCLVGIKTWMTATGAGMTIK
jgi:hypothetical protein